MIEAIDTQADIAQLARCLQPKERLQKLGPEALKTDELYALAFHTRTLEKAQALSTRYVADDLVQKNFAQLSALVGQASAASFIAARELNRRTSTVSDGVVTIRSTRDIVDHLLEYRDKKKEYLIAFFLNARHQLIVKEIISIGTLTASLAHPREIFQPAIGKAAAGVILAHNHPSGDPSPSDEDVRLTKRISQAGYILGIELLDHLIVSVNGAYSFKTAGAL